MKTTGASAGQSLPKSPTGIQDLNEITPVAGCPRGGPRSSVAVRRLGAADHFAAAGSASLRGARSPGHRAARREAGQQGGFGGSSVLVSGSARTGKNRFAFGNRSQRIGAPRPLAAHTGGCALRISK
jgi:hypothetical protein